MILGLKYIYKYCFPRGSVKCSKLLPCLWNTLEDTNLTNIKIETSVCVKGNRGGDSIPAEIIIRQENMSGSRYRSILQKI